MKVLIADDDLTSRKMLEGILTDWGYETVVVPDGDEALRVLRDSAPPQLAILDWVMPGLDGRDVCEAVRRERAERYVYILLVTAKSKTSDIIGGLEAGADDYLAKPYDPLELKARLFAGRRILDLQEQLIAAREVMRHQATRDFLTGAWNHRAITEILERELSRVRREAGSLGIILADLDHFKKVNDTHGHLAGDTVLREAVRRLTKVIRPYDFIGRYGGEEFLMVVPGANRENLAKLAERLRQSLASVPVLHEGLSIPVTGSFGVTVFAGPDTASLHALVHEADVALYRAKSQGRNRVEVSLLSSK